MQPPEDLTPEGAALWLRVVANLEERGRLVDTDREAVERYVRTADLAWRLWSQIPKRLMSRGPSNPSAHPLIGAALRTEKAAAAFGADLGLRVVDRVPTKMGRPQTRAPALDPPPSARLRDVSAGA